MKLNEFIKLKYKGKFVDTKKAVREFKENENNKKKFFTLQKAKKTNSFDYLNLKNSIIWGNKK